MRTNTEHTIILSLDELDLIVEALESLATYPAKAQYKNKKVAARQELSKKLAIGKYNNYYRKTEEYPVDECYRNLTGVI